eukprot:3226838-Pyramimonas_sp.AAC.1
MEPRAHCDSPTGQFGDRAVALCGPCGSYAVAVVAGSGDLGVISGKQNAVLLSLHSCDTQCRGMHS